MAKAKTKTFNQARKDLLARTAAGQAAIDQRAAGADMSDLEHLPVIEVRPVVSSIQRSHHVPGPAVDNRPPIAPPVCFEVEVSDRTLKAVRGAAKRSGMSVDDFTDLAVRCMLDAAEAEADTTATRTARAASSDELVASAP